MPLVVQPRKLHAVPVRELRAMRPCAAQTFDRSGGQGGAGSTRAGQAHCARGDGAGATAGAAADGVASGSAAAALEAEDEEAEDEEAEAEEPPGMAAERSDEGEEGSDSESS